MKNWMMAAVATAGVLLSSAQASVVSGNLVVNGDAETGDLSGWNAPGIVTAMEDVENLNGWFGTYAFTSADGDNPESMTQEIDLSTFAAAIASGLASFDLSAQLQNRRLGSAFDQVILSAIFMEEDGTVLGSSGSLTDPSSLSGIYDWSPVATNGLIPVGTRTALIMLQFSRSGGLSSDAFADNISFTVTSSTANPVPVPAALPLMGTALAGAAFLRRRRQKA